MVEVPMGVNDVLHRRVVKAIESLFKPRPGGRNESVYDEFAVGAAPAFWLAKRKRVRLGEVSGQNFVMYERTYAPGFHDLVFGMLRDASIVPNVSQTAAEMSTSVSLVDAHMGIAILPSSAVKHRVASVIACDILDKIPMSEIGIAVSKRVRAAAVDNLRSFALEKLGRARNSLYAHRS
jgi:DNA-binding transcriptional LysR family regulator